MSGLQVLMDRNREFAAGDVGRDAPVVPRRQVFLVTCLDPRVDPAVFLGAELGDALVVRNAGGRVTPAVIEDVAFIGYLAGVLGLAEPLFEVAIIHHTQCGTAFLADSGFRGGFAQLTGLSDTELAARAVDDPEATVRTDVEALLRAPALPAGVTVSGHVYDLATRLVTTVVAARTSAHRETVD